MKSASAEGILIGQPYGGGILLGCSFVGAVPYAIIKAPRAQGELASTAWNTSLKRVDGALSAFDGAANTKAMLEAGSELARWATDLRIGEHADWYVPSRGELLLGYDANKLLPEDERFDENSAYWSATQDAVDPAYAWYQGFYGGDQGWYHESSELRGVAVRRVALHQFQISESE